jgi:dTDP-4-dehydrorhamnose 3,5-epimerase-like enzyme
MHASKPVLLAGGLAADDRGEVTFVNDFRFEGVKRYYMVWNYRQGLIRAWHGHKREAKYVTAVSGAAVVGAVRIDDWERPSRDMSAERFVLSAHQPAVLYIPAGFANGFMSLTPDLKLMFFSTATFAESREDDFRYDARYWDIWQVVER